MIRQKVASGVRPTSSRVREALFSMLGQDLSGRRVLDAFGGAGVLGLEAWSRGAEVTIRELRGKVAARIRLACRELGANVRVEVGNALAVPTDEELRQYDVVLADPPYAMEPKGVLATLGLRCAETLILETDARTVVPDTGGGLAMVRRRVFGGTALHIFERERILESAHVDVEAS
jgi:16S rRNA (guanine(966)-N(2))-methyltransferase RsmD